MKRYGILNAEIASVLAHLGHTDAIAIADCGLPIPVGPQRIDVSIRKGLPSFVDVLDEVREDMVIEKVVFAEEIKTRNQKLHAKIVERFPDTPIAYVPHEQLKILSSGCKAIIRTGEATPYANVILYAGVIF